MSSFNLAIPIILKHEGGYVDNPKDPGGPTKFGISLRFLKEQGLFKGDLDHDGDIDINDIKKMTVEQAKDFYKACWWDKYSYQSIANQDIATKVLDLSVNMGPIQSHKLLQKAVNENYPAKPLIVDSILGNESFQEINYEDPIVLLNSFKQQALKFYLNLVNKNSKLIEFLAGWKYRALA